MGTSESDKRHLDILDDAGKHFHTTLPVTLNKQKFGPIINVE
jgi:hypothetical protein